MSVGKNVAMSIKGDMLTIKVDLSKDMGPSKSKKTRIVATTEGNQRVGTFLNGEADDREEKIGLNIYRKV